MADRYLLESSSTDGYLLEDGSGVLLLQFSTFTDSVTESATATESSSVALVTLSAITESGSATDSPSSTQVTLSEITETGIATETEDSNFITLSDITESGTATESSSSSLIYDAAISEAASATETQSSAISFEADITETTSATETVSSAQVLSPTISETVNSADESAVTQILIADIIETGTATEAAGSLQTLEALITELGSASETTSSLEENIAEITEPGGAEDTSQAAAIYLVGIVETSNAIETQDTGDAPLLSDIEEIATAGELSESIIVSYSIVVDSTVWIKFGKFSIMPCDPCAPKFIVSCLTDEPTDDFEFNIYGLANGVYYWRITEGSTILTKAFNHVEGTPLSISVADVPDGFFTTKRTFLFEILKTASSENPIPFLIGQYVEQLSIDIECNIYPSNTVGEDTTP